MGIPQSMRRARAAPLGAALLIYTGLALLLTWPLVSHLTTHLPGDGIDDPALAWNLWWMRTRLIEQLRPDIFHADWIFYPVGINLGFYTLTPLNALLSLPLQLGLSPILANNLMILSSYVLAGCGMFLLARDLLPHSGAAAAHLSRLIGCLPPLLAGLIYAFASAKLFYASLGQFNIASSHWIPFCVLYLLRTGAPGGLAQRLRSGAMAGLFLGMQAWAELTYASFLLIFAIVYALWCLLRGLLRAARGRPAGSDLLRQAGGLAAAAGVAGLALLPFLWAMVPDLLQEGDFFGRGGGFADLFSADLMGYLMPTRLHPLMGEWAASLPFPNDKGQQIYIGYSTLLLALMGAVGWLRRPTTRAVGLFWCSVTLLFWLLTLGPYLRWAGQETAVPAPFGLVSQLPFFSGNRYPSRYSVMLLLGSGLLAAAGLQQILQGRSPSHPASPAVPVTAPSTASRHPAVMVGISAGFALLFMLEQLSIPLPLSDFRVPSLYSRLAAVPGDFALLELPTGWRNGARVLGREDILIMQQQWYQTVHGKRRLGGNTSRNPDYKFQYFTQAPLLGTLIALMNGDRAHIAQVVEPELDALIEQGRSQAAQVLRSLQVDYVTLHVERSPAPLVRFVEEALPLTLVDQWQGPDWSGAASTIRLYRVDIPSLPTAPLAFALGDPASRLYLGEGWSSFGVADGRVRYATRSRPRLLLDLPPQGGELALQLYGPATLQGLTLNGSPLTWATAGGGQAGQAYQIVHAQVPPGLAAAPIDRLTLTFADGGRAPGSVLSPPQAAGWPIGTTGGFLPVGHSLAVVSAGQEVGSFAHIYVDTGTGVAVDVADQTRGYHLAALDPDGSLLARATFDTFADAAQSAAMAAWLGGWPPGTLVAGAVADEASLALGEDAVAALAALGVADNLRGRFRWSHSFVGRVGAPPASAVSVTSLLEPAVITVGAAADAVTVSAGVGQIEFRPQPQERTSAALSATDNSME